MCSEISAKEFGMMQSDIAHVKDESNKHTVILEKINEKLDNLALKRELEEYRKETDESLASLKELNNKLTNNFLIKVIVLSENKILNFFAGTVFTLFIVATGLNAMQMAQQFFQQSNVIKGTIDVKERK